MKSFTISALHASTRAQPVNDSMTELLQKFKDFLLLFIHIPFSFSQNSIKIVLYDNDFERSISYV